MQIIKVLLIVRPAVIVVESSAVEDVHAAGGIPDGMRILGRARLLPIQRIRLGRSLALPTTPIT
jgi:hypothetical protein